MVSFQWGGVAHLAVALLERRMAQIAWHNGNGGAGGGHGAEGWFVMVIIHSELDCFAQEHPPHWPKDCFSPPQIEPGCGLDASNLIERYAMSQGISRTFLGWSCTSHAD